MYLQISITLHYNTLHYITLHYITLPYLILPHLTLPYLTLPYLKLIYTLASYYLLPQITLSSVANPPLKHTTHSFSCKTSTYPEDTLCGRTLTELQNRLCSPPKCSRDSSGANISGTQRLQMQSHESKVLSDTFIPHVMPKPWNRWFYIRKTHTF